MKLNVYLKIIPQHLEIDVTDLKIGDSIHISDLNFDNVTILNQKTTVVVSVNHPKVEKEPTPEEVVAEPAEPEVIGKGKGEEENRRRIVRILLGIGNPEGRYEF